MKTKTALHVAEHLWVDTAKQSSPVNQFLKLDQERDKYSKDGKHKEWLEAMKNIQSEAVSRWANVILDVVNNEEGGDPKWH